ncbi:MAG: glycosyltransferase [Candidatus Contendobacter sp.]|nr:glycosyltransferase [Candidatus Contendobacter sp.]
MRIAYIGPGEGTSKDRLHALERLGHSVVLIDPWSWLGRSPWIGRWLHHLGGIGSALQINNRVVHEVIAAQAELIWVNQGECLGSALLKRLSSRQVPIVNYTNDDPFGGPNWQRFFAYRKALPYYDVLAVPRMVNVAEAKAAGARQVIRIFLSADEIAHRPRSLTAAQLNAYRSEVVFVGTWMPERGLFMARLIELGVPLSIWGNRWQKAREWPQLKPYWRGYGLYDSNAYAAALLSARICLGLLSKDNRDLHTSRSVEIPSLGALLCAERTQDHLDLYKDGEEAIFWGNADECAARCHELLADEARRRQIAEAGHRRALRNNLFNEPILQRIIDAAIAVAPAALPSQTHTVVG